MGLEEDSEVNIDVMSLRDQQVIRGAQEGGPAAVRCVWSLVLWGGGGQVRKSRVQFKKPYCGGP